MVTRFVCWRFGIFETRMELSGSPSLEYDDIMLLGLGEFLSSSELLKLFLGFKYGREALGETGDIGLGD